MLQAARPWGWCSLTDGNSLSRLTLRLSHLSLPTMRWVFDFIVTLHVVWGLTLHWSPILDLLTLLSPIDKTGYAESHLLRNCLNDKRSTVFLMYDLWGIQVHVLYRGRTSDLRIKDEAKAVLGIDILRDIDCEISLWVDILWRFWGLQLFKRYFNYIVLIFYGLGTQHRGLCKVNKEQFRSVLYLFLSKSVAWLELLPQMNKKGFFWVTSEWISQFLLDKSSYQHTSFNFKPTVPSVLINKFDSHTDNIFLQLLQANDVDDRSLC